MLSFWPSKYRDERNEHDCVSRIEQKLRHKGRGRSPEGQCCTPEQFTPHGASIRGTRQEEAEAEEGEEEEEEAPHYVAWKALPLPSTKLQITSLEHNTDRLPVKNSSSDQAELSKKVFWFGLPRISKTQTASAHIRGSRSTHLSSRRLFISAGSTLQGQYSPLPYRLRRCPSRLRTLLSTAVATQSDPRPVRTHTIAPGAQQRPTRPTAGKLRQSRVPKLPLPAAREEYVLTRHK